MKKINVAINGFGRIGRVTARYLLQHPEINLVAVNDLADATSLAHLFKYDSIHGKYNGTVQAQKDTIVIDNKKIIVLNHTNPDELPWKKLEIDIVIESTGRMTSRDGASKHIKAGAKKVIISAPAKDDDIVTIVLGINDELISSEETIISNASCTTNCAAPLIQVVEKLCGIESCFVSTIHSYTSDQRLHDAPHSDLRRARAAAMSIIPTTTGAAKAITKIFPHLEGKVGGCGIRVPVPDGSLTDITFIVKKPVSEKEIHEAFKKASEGYLKGILSYTDEPVVGIDCVGDPHSCIYDAGLTAVIGNMVKVVGWYDNESGYSARLTDLVKRIG
jgi:glyceraldehyde 3-phosphate dehydrogenase